MAAVEVTISGMLYDKLARTTQNVVLIGEATLTGLGVGGGPIIPPDKPPQPGDPPHPAHPIVLPGDPGWGPPIIKPPPGMTPPDISPGDPTTPVPPPAGQPGWPVNPMTPPPFIIVNYPGIGPVYVAPPAST